MRKAVLSFGITLAASAAYLGWVFGNRYASSVAPPDGRPAAPAREAAELERLYGGTEVRILQFYGPSGTLVAGRPVTICYGVVNARSVRIEPPVEGVGPSLNRCVQAFPMRDTRYTLTAEGHDGRIVSESFVLQVKPDPATLPRANSLVAGGRTP